MKKQFLFVLLTLALFLPLPLQAQVVVTSTTPFVEDFELTSLTRDDWTQINEYGYYDWEFGTGPGISYSPSSAHGGACNAFFAPESYDEDETKLVSPVLNTSALTSSLLSFWYINPSWGGDVDELTVYYRTSTTGSWTLLGSFTAPMSAWTYVELDIPTTSATLQIAFNGYCNYGYGIGIDDVMLAAPPTCPQTSPLSVSSITTSSLTLHWTELGSASSWEIEYDSVNFTPGSGSANLVTAYDTSYTLSDLDSGTTYFIYLHADCGNGDISYNRFVSATTLAASPATVPYTCNFEQEGVNGWDLINGSQPNSWCVGSAAHNGSGSRSLYISNDNGTSNNYTSGAMWAFATRTIQIDEAGEYAYSFDWLCEGESTYDYLRAALVPMTVELSAGDACGFSTSSIPSTAIALDGGSKLNLSSNWSTHTGTVLINTPGTYQWVFAWHNDVSVEHNPAATIDNVMFVQNTCPQVQNVHLVAATVESLTVAWQPGGSETEWAVSDGTQEDVSNDTTYTFYNLTPNTVYNLSVRAVCATDDTSMVCSISARTACGLITSLPYTEDFEQYPVGTTTSAEFVPCWIRINNGTTYFGYPYVSGTSTYNHTTGGTNSLYWYASTTTGTYGDYMYAILPQADPDLYPVNTLQLNFYAKATSTSYHPVFEVGVMTDPDDVSTFQSITTLHVEGTDWSFFECPLGAYTGTGNYVAIKATRPSSSWYAAIDDVTLRVAPSCYHINDLTFEAATASSARISWSIGNPLNYTGASIDIKESGDTWDNAANYSEFDNLYYVLSGLNAGTSYDVRVAALCNSELSDYDSLSFITANFGCAVIDPDNSHNDTVGNGTSTNYALPVNNYFKYCFTEQLFEASELSGAGTLTSLSFDYAYATPTTSKTDCQIYVASTSMTSLSSSSFVRPEDMTLVYEGPMNCTNGWNTFAFNRGTFNYDGTSNLLIAVLDNSNAFNGMSYVFHTHSASGKAVGHQSDSNPFSGSAANVYSYRSNVIFTFQECLTPSTCSAPALSIDYVGPDTVSISWLPGASESSWDLYANGEFVATTSTPQYDFDNLNPNTDYTFRVVSNCGSDDTAYAEISARTACGYITTLPFVEDFEQQPTGTSSTGSPFITCWSRLNNGTTYGAYPYVSSSSSYNHTTGGTKGLYWYANTTTGTYGDYLCVALPAADPSLYPVNTLQLTFFAKPTSTSYHPVFEVGVMTDPNDITTFQTVATLNVNNTDWTEYEFPLSTYTGNGRYVAIKATRPSTSWYACIDDITLAPIPDCPKPSEISVSSVSTTSITLDWQEFGSATSWSVEYGPVGFTPGTGMGTVETANDTNYTITDLDSATTYDIYVHALCDGGDTSYNRFVAATTLASSPATVPYVCDFEQEGPNGWDLVNGTQSNVWCVGSAAHNGNGTRSLYISDDAGITNDYSGSATWSFATRTFNIEEAGEYAYSFDWLCAGESTYDYLRVALAPMSVELTAGDACGFGTSTLPAGAIALDGGSKLNLSSNWNTQSGTVQINTPGTYRWVFTWHNDASVYNVPAATIDNVMLVQNTCPQIQDLHVVAVTDESVTIAWQAGGSETEWAVSDGTNDDFAYDTSYTFTNLTPNTGYTFSVRGVCGDGDSSMISFVSTRTACGFITSFPWTETFESYTANTVVPCWDNTASTTTTLSSTPYYVWGVYNTSGNNMLRMYNSLVQSGATYMKSPILSLPEDGSVYELDFFYSHKASSGAMTISVITPDSVVTLGSLANTTSTYNTTDPGELQEAIYSLANFAGQNIQIQFSNQANYGSGAIFVDNVTVQLASSCPRVENLAVDYSNGDTVSLVWDGNGEFNFQIAYGPLGFSLDTVQSNIVSVMFDTNYTFTGLPLGVTYDFYVRADCGTEQGNWRGPVSAMTGYFYPMLVSGVDTLNNACGYIITDDGGAMGTYSSNANSTLVVLPSNNNETLIVSGHSFTESSYDYITIYDGVGITGTVLWTDNGINQDTPFGPFTSEEGAVTITFHSDGSVVKDGFEIAVQCVPASGCLRPNQLAVTSLDNQNATIDWNERGTASSWNIEYGPAGFAHGSSSAVMTSTTSHPFTISNLTPATSYDVYVMSDCGGDTSLWSGPLQFTTLTVMPATVPFSCDFTDTTLNCGFEFVNGSQSNKWVVGTAESNITPRALYISNNNGSSNAYTNSSSQVSYAYRTLQLQGGEYTYSYDWKANGEGSYDYLRVWLAPASAQFTPGQLPDGTTSMYNYTSSTPTGWYPLDGGSKLNLQTTWQNQTDVVTVPTGTYHMVFMWCNDASSGTNPPAAVDNVVFVENTCPRPTDISISSLTQTSATLSWSEAGSASTWQYQLDALAITTVIDTFCTLNNLSANTPYTFRVRSICGAGDTSLWLTYQFRTPCSYVNIPYTEDFEACTTGSSSTGSQFVDCWIRLNDGTSYGGYPYVSSSSSYNHTTGGSKGLYWYNSSSPGSYGSYQCAVLPPLDASTPANTLQLSFWAKVSSASYTSAFQVGVMTDPNDVTSFVGVDTVTCASTSWMLFEVPLDAYLGSGQFVAIKSDSPTSSWYAYVDDVTLDLIPTCPKVTNLNMVSSSSSSLTIDWTDHAASTAEWQISYATASGTPSIITAYGHPATIQGLSSTTAYTVAVRPICSVGDTGYWSEAVNVTTTICDDAIITSTGNPTGTSYVAPVNNYYNYTLTETIIDSAELNGPQSISAISFYYDYVSPSTGKTDVDIYLQPTTTSSFVNSSSIEALNPTTAVLVYSGSLNCSQGWNLFSFDTPYEYEGMGNLLVIVDDNSGDYDGSAYVFATASCNGNKTIAYYDDSDNPDVTTPATFDGYNTNFYSWRPVMQLISCGGATCPAPSIASVTHDYQSATVSWSGSGSHYQVAIRTANQGSYSDPVDVNANRYTFTALQPATLYYFQVRQDCTADSNDYSAWTEGYFTTDSLPCFAPSAFQHTASSNDGASFSWVIGSTESAWEIHVFNTAYDHYFTVRTNPASVSGLTVGTTYHAAIRALCGAYQNIEGEWSDTIQFSTSVCDPVNSVRADAHGLNVTITWTPGENNTDTWEVEYGNHGYGQGEQLGTMLSNTPSYTFLNLDPETTYDFHVRALCSQGWHSIWSSVATATTGTGEGIYDVEGNFNCNIFPNPASDETTISVSGVNGKVTIAVVDMNGRTVSSETLDCSADCEKKMNVSGLTQGAYFVRIFGDNVNSVKKLIVR